MIGWRALAASGLLAGSAAAAQSPAPAPSPPAAAAARAPSTPAGLARAGRYLHTSPDTGAQLELAPDGRFRFFFSVGALDAHAEGTWRSDGATVWLTGDRRPVPPVFEPGPVGRQDEAPFRIRVEAPRPDGGDAPAGERGLTAVRLRVEMADGRVVEGQTSNEGWVPWREEGEGRPVAVSLSGYGVDPVRFPLDIAAGNDFAFRFIANDFGLVDFQDEPLPVRGDALVLVYGGDPDRGLVFERVDPNATVEEPPPAEDPPR